METLPTIEFFTEILLTLSMTYGVRRTPVRRSGDTGYRPVGGGADHPVPAT
jgi:hypothetical protein